VKNLMAKNNKRMYNIKKGIHCQLFTALEGGDGHEQVQENRGVASHRHSYFVLFTVFKVAILPTGHKTLVVVSLVV
jgi:hypothetical protein